MEKQLTLKMTRRDAGSYIRTIGKVEISVWLTHLDHSGEWVWICEIDGPGFSSPLGDPMNSADMRGDYHFTKRDCVAWAAKQLEEAKIKF